MMAHDKSEVRKYVGAMRIAQRKDLIYAISGIDMDAIENDVPVEISVGADFFYACGLSMWVWKVQGARLFNWGSIEILGDKTKKLKNVDTVSPCQKTILITQDCSSQKLEGNLFRWML